jgi:Xaa-Pro aminopeptidase
MSASELPSLQTATRIARLRERIAEEELDCLLVGALTNVRYLSGFTGSAGLLAVTRDAARLVTDGRYRTQASEQLDSAGVAPLIEIVVGRIPAQNESIVDLVHETVGAAGGRVGLEAEHVVWAQKRRWAELLLPSEPVATSGLVEGLRVVKDAGEVARIERAAVYAD